MVVTFGIQAFLLSWKMETVFMSLAFLHQIMIFVKVILAPNFGTLQRSIFRVGSTDISH